MSVLLSRADLDSAVRQLWKADPANVKQACTRYALDFKQIAMDQKRLREHNLEAVTRNLEQLQAKLSWTEAEVREKLQGYMRLNKIDLATAQRLKTLDLDLDHPTVKAWKGCQSWKEVQQVLGYEVVYALQRGVEQFEASMLQERTSQELFQEQIFLRELQADLTIAKRVQHNEFFGGDSAPVVILLCQRYAEDPASFKRVCEEYVRLSQAKVDRLSEPGQREQANQRVLNHLKEAIKISEGYLAGRDPNVPAPPVVLPASPEQDPRFAEYYAQISLDEPEATKPKPPQP